MTNPRTEVRMTSVDAVVEAFLLIAKHYAAGHLASFSIERSVRMGLVRFSYGIAEGVAADELDDLHRIPGVASEPDEDDEYNGDESPEKKRGI